MRKLIYGCIMIKIYVWFTGFVINCTWKNYINILYIYTYVYAYIHILNDVAYSSVLSFSSGSLENESYSNSLNGMLAKW